MRKIFKFGLCCISLGLKDKGFSMRSITFKNFSALAKIDALKKLSQICLNNAKYAGLCTEFCAKNSISRFRISSAIFPLLTHPQVDLKIDNLPDSKEIFKALKHLGNISKNENVKLSFHPSQYVAIASSNRATIFAAAKDINLNAEILDLAGLAADFSSPINIHINRNPASSDFVKDFEFGLSKLTKSARLRLVIENEDKGFWNTQNLLEFLKPYKIPVTLDVLHEKCNPSKIPLKECFFKAKKTWQNFEPAFHYAESASKKCPRSHSDFCKFLPPDFDKDCVWMIEAKAKDSAIKKLAEMSNKL